MNPSDASAKITPGIVKTSWVIMIGSITGTNEAIIVLSGAPNTLEATTQSFEFRRSTCALIWTDIPVHPVNVSANTITQNEGLITTTKRIRRIILGMLDMILMMNIITASAFLE